jgi:UDP-N-acetylmuramate--alanine ligase
MFQHTADYLAPLEGDYSAYHHTTSFSEIALAGQARRDDAFLAKQVLLQIDDYDESELDKILSDFPGSGRRFEQLAPNLISDYAHHPTEIAATVQMALEINPNVVVVYEPHQNQRQLQTISQYQTIFQGVKQLYWLPTYMPSGGREKNSKILRPEDFIQTLSGVKAEAAQIDRALWDSIEAHIAAGDLVVAMSAGGLDAWLRTKLAQETD